MKSRIFILGSGFGGMELSTSLLSTTLSEATGKRIDVTLIDKPDGLALVKQIIRDDALKLM